VARELDPDELIDRWTLLGDELNLVAGKRGATKLGFALLLRFYTERGQFPRGRGEIPNAAVDYVARQVGVNPTEIAFYEWSGRTIEFHRAQIRKALGFRECIVADADALVEWLITNVTQSERGGERVRERLLARCRTERIEAPTSRPDRSDNPVGIEPGRGLTGRASLRAVVDRRSVEAARPDRRRRR
jgi:hypothetical protein